MYTFPDTLISLNTKTQPSDTSFELTVCWKRHPQVDSHCNSNLLGSMFLKDLRLHLEPLLLIEVVQRTKAQWFLFQKSLQPCAPGLQHGITGLCGDTGGSPEDLWGQNLEATVVQDTILERVE